MATLVVGRRFCRSVHRVGPEERRPTVRQQALRARPVVVADARRYVRDRLDGVVTSDRLSDVQLLTSELVTNAVRHAGLKEGDAVYLEVDVDIDTVHVAVVDGGAGFDFSKILDEPGDPRGGWGLILVGKVSDRWGIDASPLHTVWFEIDLLAQPSRIDANPGRLDRRRTPDWPPLRPQRKGETDGHLRDHPRWPRLIVSGELDLADASSFAVAFREALPPVVRARWI